MGAAYGGGRLLRFSLEGRLARDIAPRCLPVATFLSGEALRDPYVTSSRDGETSAHNTDDDSPGGCVFWAQARVSGLEVPLPTV